MSSEQALDILKHFPKISKFESVVMAAGGATGIIGGAAVIVVGKTITEELAKSAVIFAGIGGVAGVLIGYAVSVSITSGCNKCRTHKLKQRTSDFIQYLKQENDPNAEKLSKLLNSFEKGMLNEEQFCDNILNIILKYCHD